MLVIQTLKNKISDFLNSNTCFCLQLYGNLECFTPYKLILFCSNVNMFQAFIVLGKQEIVLSSKIQ